MTVGRSRPNKIILLDRGVGIAAILKMFLAGKDVIHVTTVQEALQHASSACDTLLCSLLLSHSANADDCLKTVMTLAQAFRSIAFFEPSAYGADYLASLGLKNFHAGFKSNKFMGSVTVDFLVERTPAYAVTHFGCNAAFVASSAWIVPLDYPDEAFPKPDAVAGTMQFRFPVYEYSCFLYSSFDSPQFDLEEDLYFIERRIRQAPIHLSGFDSTNWVLLKDAGAQEYITGQSDYSCQPDNRDVAALSSRCRVDLSGPASHPVESTWTSNIIPEKFKSVVSRLDRCIIAGTGAVITEERLVAESSYLLHLMHGSNWAREGLRRPHPVGHVDGLAVIAINSVSYNYYHWLAQIMPFLGVAKEIVRKRGESRITIITGRTSRFHDEFIDALFADFDDVTTIRLKTGEYVAADMGLYSNIMSNDGPKSIVAEQLHVVRQLKSAFADRGGPASRLLYIARTDTKARRIINEDELIELARARGFEILLLSEMSVREQIAAFSQARIVLGGHGAGMTNILFSSEETHLIELQHSTYANNCMLRLTQNIGGAHTVKFFFPVTPETSRHAEWQVDVDQVAALLDRVMAGTAGSGVATAQGCVPVG